MNILFVTDKGYMTTLINYIRSIVRFPTEGGYDFYILHSNLSTEEIQTLEEAFAGEACRFHPVEIDEKRFEGFPESKRYPKQIYYRILAAAVLPDHLDRILYLDADIVVIRSLDTLYHMDFEGNYYMACTHVRAFLTMANMARLGKKEIVPYINTGVLMMNLAVLRKEQDISAVRKYVLKHQKSLLLPDQDIMTVLYGDKIKVLDSEIYNLSDRVLALHNANPRLEMKNVDWVREHTVIIHYCGRNKPWKENYIGVLGTFYDELMEEQN